MQIPAGPSCGKERLILQGEGGIARKESLCPKKQFPVTRCIQQYTGGLGAQWVAAPQSTVVCVRRLADPGHRWVPGPAAISGRITGIEEASDVGLDGRGQGSPPDTEPTFLRGNWPSLQCPPAGVSLLLTEDFSPCSPRTSTHTWTHTHTHRCTHTHAHAPTYLCTHAGTRPHTSTHPDTCAPVRQGAWEHLT